MENLLQLSRHRTSDNVWILLAGRHIRGISYDDYSSKTLNQNNHLINAPQKLSISCFTYACLIIARHTQTCGGRHGVQDYSFREASVKRLLNWGFYRKRLVRRWSEYSAAYITRYLRGITYQSEKTSSKHEKQFFYDWRLIRNIRPVQLQGKKKKDQ